MKRSVTIALIGDAKRQGPSDPIPPRELDRSYEERPRVILEVSESDRVGDFMAQAARELKVHRSLEYEPTYIGFRRPEDANETPPVFASLLPIIKADGQVRWTWNVREVTYGEILRAAEGGAIYGDPEQMHFAMVPMVGNGVLPDWGLLVTAYEALKLALEHVELGVAAFEGTRIGAALLRRLKQRSEQAPSSFSEHGDSWTARGGDPHALDVWLDQRPWEADRLAGFLECNSSEAEAVLWAFGFGECADGLWRRNADEAAKFMADIKQVVTTTGHLATPVQLQSEFENRAKELAETGQAPPLDWEKLEWLGHFSSPASPGSGLLARLRDWRQRHR